MKVAGGHVYAEVRFKLWGEDATALLHADGWRLIAGEAGLGLDGLLNIIAGPADVPPAMGDPMAFAARRLAEVLKGECTIRPSEAAPGRIY